MIIATYLFSLLIQRKVLGLNTLDTLILCVGISPELLQTMLPLANIILNISLKNHLLVLAETI